MGTRLLAAWSWLIAHKAPIGGFITPVSLTMIAYGGGKWWVLLLAFGAGLTGAGVAPSDRHVQEKQAWEKQGVDRRTGGP